jgi:hypothetical protein
MKKMLFTLTVLASAFCAMTFTACGDKAPEAASDNKPAADAAANAAKDATDGAADAAKDAVDGAADAAKDAADAAK